MVGNEKNYHTSQSEPSVEAQRFVAILLTVMPTGQQLRQDPAGQSWLGAEGLALIHANQECQQFLDEFVTRELQLFSSVQQEESKPFIWSVVRATKSAEITGLNAYSHSRTIVLGIAYLAATAVFFCLWNWQDGTDSLREWSMLVRNFVIRP